MRRFVQDQKGCTFGYIIMVSLELANQGDRYRVHHLDPNQTVHLSTCNHLYVNRFCKSFFVYEGNPNQL